MASVKVVITDYIEPELGWETEQFKQLGVDFSYHQLKQAAPPELLEVIADASEADEKLVRSLGADLVVRRGDDVASAAAAAFRPRTTPAL